MQIYRYRSFDTACKEIESKKIYFADRKSLNDPMEGFLQVHWQGDEVAWKGLFRNYICSLDNALTAYLLQVDRERIKEFAALIDVHIFDNVPYGKSLKELGDVFLREVRVKELIHLYGKAKLKCSRKELQALLRLIHNRALQICIEKQVERGGMAESELEIVRQIHSGADGLGIPYNEYCQIDTDTRVKLLEVIENYLDDAINSIMINYYNTMEEQKKSWLLVQLEFPIHYVEKIMEFIHPEAYVTCFSLNSLDSSMWGNYAGNHTGVCLIYETYKENEKEVMPLNLPYCAHGNNKTEYKYVDVEMHQVEYGGYEDNVNFFYMLGRLTGEQIHHWLTDETGIKSSCLDDIYKNEDEWRKFYWDCLKGRYCHKTIDWFHEKEYRLLLYSTLFDLSSRENRLISYRFENLKGIIFGMNMSRKNQYILVSLVKQQCKKLGRDNFLFFQAYYDDKNQCIKAREIKI